MRTCEPGQGGNAAALSLRRVRRSQLCLSFCRPVLVGNYMKLALYRKYRPAQFSDVVGQEDIITALRNQIIAGRTGHAYLFTGVRGTGKTTVARMRATAVN